MIIKEDRPPMELPPCPGHEWVAPVTRNPDNGALWLTHPDDPSLTAVEHPRLLRGHLIVRMVFCRFCGAKPKGGE